MQTRDVRSTWRPGLAAGLIGLLAWASGTHAGNGARPPPVGELHAIATAHLDTQWRWTVRDTIRAFLPETLRANAALFEKYPAYVFNFDGALRYMLIKEYYPAAYERLKRHIAVGNWSVCGPGLDQFDTNLPAPESLIRSILYSQMFYRREFGLTTRDMFLPDSFGFSQALPTIARHCGMLGFSTQKLGWGCAAGIPFRLGVWEGVDGSALPAVLHAEPYNALIRENLADSPGWVHTVAELGERAGVWKAYRYFGTGDKGGAPDEASVAWVQAAAAGTGQLDVVSGTSDALFRDLTAEQIARLPRYAGELLMTTHGTGCYTAQGALKRWNRMNERASDAAERAAVAADWLGATPYPAARLRAAGIRFLWHQQHDGLTGTSLPAANAIMLNDEAVAHNVFSGILRHAVGAWSQTLDTRAAGIPVVVYNPLGFEREDTVEAHLAFAADAPACVRVFGPDGRETPSQVIRSAGRRRTVIFAARVPGVGLAVYDVRPSSEPCRLDTGLTIADGVLENARFRVRLDASGDVASMLDKRAGRELLAAPIAFTRLPDKPERWPAWEIRYCDIASSPLVSPPRSTTVRVIEAGPVRVAATVTATFSNAVFTTHVRLDASPDKPLTINGELDWRADGELLKVRFPFACPSAIATYDTGIGAIRRGTNSERRYEVPAQKWADLSADDGSGGVAVLTDAKYGWDHPAADVLRLTLLHTPAGSRLDVGRHPVRYAVFAHDGDWRSGVVRAAAGFDQPLLPFVSDPHPGARGRTMSFLDMGDADVTVLALKQSEDGRSLVVRLAESGGREQRDIRVRFPAAITVAREVNGLEDTVGTATFDGDALLVDLERFQVRAFAVTLAEPETRLDAARSWPVTLPYNSDAIDAPDEKGGGALDRQGVAYPAEQFPETLTVNGIAFRLGDTAAVSNNVVRCRGQRIALPAGTYNTVHILAASSDGDVDAVFRLGGQDHTLAIQDFGAAIASGTPPYVKSAAIGRFGTHCIDAAGARVPYTYCYLFDYALPCAADARVLQLPHDERIGVFAVTAADDPGAGVQSAMAPDMWDEPTPAPGGNPWRRRLVLGCLLVIACTVAIARILRSVFAARAAT